MARQQYLLVLPVFFLAACIGFDSDGVQGDHHQYVTDRIVVPDGDAAVTSLGFDLDADGSKVDNAFGGALNVLPGVSSFFQSAIDNSLTHGTVIVLADLQTKSLSDATDVGINLYLGSEPSTLPCQDTSDMVCAHHLDGQTSFLISPTSPIDTLLGGEIHGGRLAAGPGTITLEMDIVSFLPPIRLDLVGAFVEGDVSDGKLVNGKLGGGITQSQILGVLIPGVSAAIDTIIARDCPNGPPSCCTAGTAGAQLVATLDTSGDCAVGPIEITLQVAPLFGLDVDLLDDTGNYNPGKDGARDAFSIGLGFSAISASFTRP